MNRLEDEDRDAGEDRVDQPQADVGEDARRRRRPAGQRARLLLQLGRDVVVLLQLAQPLVLRDELLQVGDVRGQVVDQQVELLDHGRHEQRREQHGHQDQADVDERDGEARGACCARGS